MRTINKRVEKLERNLGTKEPLIKVILEKYHLREEWGPQPANTPPGIIVKWIDPQDLDNSH